MKLDLGRDGRILGTKRVSPNGQVSGFTEYAGMDVLVILPGGHAPVVRKDASDLIAEAEALVRERMELAFREYKNLRAKYTDPDTAARAFLQQVKGFKLRGLVRRADVWIRDQLGNAGSASKRDGRARAPRKTKEV